MEKRESGLEASKLRMEVEESLKQEFAANFSNNNALTKPSLRDLPIVIISASQSKAIRSPQTVTFDSFLANFNNAARPGGGDGVLDLDSAVFTCFTPGYYTVSFSAYADLVISALTHLYLYKNDTRVPESYWLVGTNDNDATNFGVVSSRIMVSDLLDMYTFMKIVKSFLQILHMDEGDTLELRMTDGRYIDHITLNIELIGLGYD